MPYSLPIDVSEYNRLISRSDDKKAGRILLTELETRITGRHLSFRSGNEKQIASDVIQFLKRAREITLEYNNAPRFRIIALCTINNVLAPHADRWSAWLSGDFFDNCRIFRTELNELSVTLTRIQSLLRSLIDGKRLTKTDLLVNIPVSSRNAVSQIRSAKAKHEIASGLRAGTLERDAYIPYLKRHVALIRQLCDESIDQAAVTPVRRQLDGIDTDIAEQQAELQLVPRSQERDNALDELKVHVVEIGSRVENMPVFIRVFQSFLDLKTAINEQAEPAKSIETQINEAEWEDVRRIRNGTADNNANTDHPSNVAGLALSGGGIRSATFALGVCQCLSKHGLFQHFDYLSTVSGGGYLGSYISAHSNQLKANGEQAPQDSVILDEKGLSNDADDQQYVRHLRNHSKEMRGQGFLGICQSLQTIMIGMATNILAVSTFISFLAILTWLLHHGGLWGDWAENTFTEYFTRFEFTSNPAMWIALWMIVAAIVFNLFVKQFARLWANKLALALVEKATNTITLWAFKVTVLALVPLLFITIKFLRSLEIPSVLPRDDWILLGSAILAALSGPLSGNKPRLGMSRQVLRFISLFSGTAFFLLVFGYIFFFTLYMENNIGLYHTILWLGSTQVCLVIHLFLFDPNSGSLHTIYRRRLCACYLHFGNKNTRLPKLSQLNGNAPYYLVNCTVNLHGSKNRDLRGRDGDFFFFSKHYSGSRLTGFYSTTEFEEDDDKLDIGTAMAISGAAFSSNMGNQSTSKYRVLLTLLNIRLGYWLRNLKRKKRVSAFGGSQCLNKELLGTMKEDDRYLNLSDGGHIENFWFITEVGAVGLLKGTCCG